MITLQDLLAMSNRERRAIVDQGRPLDLEAMADTQYLGVDLSLPKIANRILWKTFRKTFHRDPGRGILRGWNVRMEQTGIDGPAVPMCDRRGQPKTFGHYHVCSATGVNFPGGWSGAHYLDYGIAGNLLQDVGRFGFAPLVTVNEGSHELLLGWEVMKVGPVFLPLPDYWALQLQGPLTEVVPVPRPGR